MKLLKKIAKHKFQFLFFVGLVGLLAVALVISSVNSKNNTDKPVINTDDPEDPIADVVPEETIIRPFEQSMEYVIVRRFYEKDGTKEEQKESLIKYQNSFRTSVGTSYAKKDGTTFDVLSVLSGKVVEVKSSPLYNNYVIVEHSDGLKTTYYGLSEVTVTVGNNVNQGDKLGVCGKTEIDAETGNHVYLKMTKAGKNYNPEKLIGKKISEITD